MGSNYYLFNGNEAAIHLGVDWKLSELIRADLGFGNLRALIEGRRVRRSDINAINNN
jgi:hypothetical protein